MLVEAQPLGCSPLIRLKLSRNRHGRKRGRQCQKWRGDSTATSRRTLGANSGHLVAAECGSGYSVIAAVCEQVALWFDDNAPEETRNSVLKHDALGSLLLLQGLERCPEQ